MLEKSPQGRTHRSVCSTVLPKSDQGVQSSWRQIQSHCFWAEQATVLPQSLHLVVVTVFVPTTSVSVETVCSCVRVFVRPHCADY